MFVKLVIFVHVIGIFGQDLGKIEHFDFNYKDLSDWIKHSQSCIGKHQSPINIDNSLGGDVLTEVYHYPPLVPAGYNIAPTKLTVTNNGHTAQVTVPEGMTVTGGPLNATYSFAQMHFHWGSNDSQGSEHSLDGKSFPIELHFVHFNRVYGSMDNAMNKPDGLLVFGVFGEVSGLENLALKPVTDTLAEVIISPRTAVAKNETLHPMQDLLPKNIDVYYHYEGSLTTPNCFESVTWIVFESPIGIDEDQLNAFRKLMQGGLEHELLLNNFRPRQDLNERKIEKVLASSGSSISIWSSYVLLLYLSLGMRRF